MSREGRRAALLDAAAAGLRRRERTPLTFEAIATEAGVSSTLPYKYFDSIDDVAEALYRQVVGTVDDETDVLLCRSRALLRRQGPRHGGAVDRHDPA